MPSPIIDFDAASEAWMMNKIKHSQGTYLYVCGHTTKRGTRCRNRPVRGCSLCHIHARNNTKK